MRFCSRCGFPLDGVKTLLERGGRTEAEDAYQHSPVKRAVRQGIFIMIFGFLIAALLQVMSRELNIPRFTGDLFAIAGLFLGIMRVVSATVFPPPKPVKSVDDRQREFRPAPAVAALPDPQTDPLSVDDVRSLDARDAVRVPSVTEDTTRQLK